MDYVSFYHFNESKGFIFYLTKTQIKKLTEARKEGYFKGRMSLIFSTNQLLKTYKEVIKINSYIYHYKEIDRFYKQKSNTPKLLAITDKPHNKEELLDLTKNLEKDLRANAQKNRAKSAKRGHSSKPNLPSFSVCNKVLMSL